MELEIEVKVIIFGVIAIIAIGAAAIFFGTSWDYRWKQQCAAMNGVQLESTNGSRICVRGPVEIVTIAARPW